MLQCQFRINGKETSRLEIDNRSYPAFSGFEIHVNNLRSQCIQNLGPIPKGKYYIVDRATGVLQKLNAWLTARDDWFALFAIDENIDEFVLCNGIRRGKFRLNPIGDEGISLGCVTLINKSDFKIVRTTLLAQPPKLVGKHGAKAYGILNVV